MTKRLTLWLLGALSVAFGADPRWIRVPSTDFEIYSSAGEGDTRRTLQYFEQVRSFFEQKMKGSERKSEPVRVIMFGSKKEFDPYRPNQVAMAYYTQTGGRDYIVLGNDADALHVAVHEYMHLVTRHAGMKFAPWLNEGIAEIFGTFQPIGGRIQIGAPIPGRLYGLSRDKWVPLETILSVDQNSPYYNEKDKAGSLYNEGWALTHMLELSPQYIEKFPAFLNELQQGTESRQAIEKTWGKPLSAVEKDLQSYIRGNQFRVAVFNVKLEKVQEKPVIEPALPFDLKLALLDLSNRPGREAQTERDLNELAAMDSKRPEPEVGLGYLAWRSNQQAEAVKHFAKAFDMGSRNTNFLWDFGRLASGADQGKSIEALSALLSAEPDRRDVRLTLADIQMAARRPKDALATASPIKSVSKEEAPQFFRVMAFAFNDTGNPEEARSAARRWKENAKDAMDGVSAERYLAYLESLNRAGNNQVAAAPRMPAPQVDSLNPPGITAGVVARKGPGNLATYTGVFIEMQCDRELSRLTLESAGVRSVFLMDDPDKVTAKGLTDRKVVDLACGRQKPVAVTLNYEPAAEATGVKGIVREIEFASEPEALPETPAAGPTSPPTPARPYVAGSFVELECATIPPRMILQAGKERIAFLLDAVDRLLAYGLPDGKGIEMNCGPVKPVSVWIEYDPPSANQRNVRGLARGIHFEPVPSGLKTR